MYFLFTTLKDLYFCDYINNTLRQSCQSSVTILSCRAKKLHNSRIGVGALILQITMQMVPLGVDEATDTTFIYLFIHVYLQAHIILYN